MDEMITMTREQKREMLAAVCSPKFKLDVIYSHRMRRYTVSDKKGNVIYSIDAYNDNRRVVMHNGNVIADTATFGNNFAEIHAVNYILSVLIDNYNRDITKAVLTGKAR